MLILGLSSGRMKQSNSKNAREKNEARKLMKPKQKNLI